MSAGGLLVYFLSRFAECDLLVLLVSLISGLASLAARCVVIASDVSLVCSTGGAERSAELVEASFVLAVVLAVAAAFSVSISFSFSR